MYMIDSMLLISEYSGITLNNGSTQSKKIMIILFEYVDDFQNFILIFSYCSIH